MSKKKRILESEKSEEIKDISAVKEPQKKKRKKWPWILLSIFLALTVAVIVVVHWQWNNIMALYYANTYTVEQLQAMQQENEVALQELCSQVSTVDISRLPEEAQEMLESGELSEEDAVLILTGQKNWEDLQAVDAGSDNPPQPESVSRVDDIIARIYLLRSNYVGRLDSLVSQAWSEYKKGGISKQDLINKYLGIGYGLEGECDAQMEALLSELHAELTRIGGDTNLVNSVRQTYLSQKSIKKAELIAKYQK